jgi:hypothetical protein
MPGPRLKGVNRAVSLEQNRSVVGTWGLLLPSRLDYLDECFSRGSFRRGEEIGSHVDSRSSTTATIKAGQYDQGSPRATADRNHTDSGETANAANSSTGNRHREAPLYATRAAARTGPRSVDTSKRTDAGP